MQLLYSCISISCLVTLKGIFSKSLGYIVAHDFSYHLPSTGPPLFLLAFLPQPAVTSPFRLMLWDFVQKTALINMGIVLTCYTDFEIRRKIRLAPLHLQSYTSPFHEAILPPFLPEKIEYTRYIKSSSSSYNKHNSAEESSSVNQEESQSNDHIVSRTLSNISIYTRKLFHKDPTVAEEQRQLIIHELMALQKLKNHHQHLQQHHDHHHGMNGGNDQHGYALVTGASRGIGRALAVELARWGIPLILVARSENKLSTLAQELEACYGIRCYALPADLSDPKAAYMVYNTTKEAGLRVDILVNNAGICTRGELVESSTSDISRLIHLNIGAVTTLSQLYGKDMKKQRKGRILFVSSIAAGAPSTPEVAAYAASKAYEKSLSMAMSMELAKYGVGVTCLMPGAVKDTSFASTSHIDDALCWKIPGYAMKAPDVASVGIRALLNGAVEVVPGWHNFSFLKYIVPTLPQRVSSTIASMAFRPISAKSNHSPRYETLDEKPNEFTEDVLPLTNLVHQTNSTLELAPQQQENEVNNPIR